MTTRSCTSIFCCALRALEGGLSQYSSLMTTRSCTLRLSHATGQACKQTVSCGGSGLVRRRYDLREHDRDICKEQHSVSDCRVLQGHVVHVCHPVLLCWHWVLQACG